MSIPTLAEIKESLPRQIDAKLFDYDPHRNISSQVMAKKLYGPYVRPLTRALIKRFMGKTLPVIGGQNWHEKTTEKRMRQIEKLKPLRFDDELDHLWSDWTAFGFGEQDYVYFDGDDAVTGSGGDPMFVFLKDARTPAMQTLIRRDFKDMIFAMIDKNPDGVLSAEDGMTLKRAVERAAGLHRGALDEPGKDRETFLATAIKLVNERVPQKKAITTKRFRMKDGKRIAESVPKTKHGRKAPPGHAKDYKNKKAVGLDGGLWISKPAPKTGVYRWIVNRVRF